MWECCACHTHVKWPNSRLNFAVVHLGTGRWSGSRPTQPMPMAHQLQESRLCGEGEPEPFKLSTKSHFPSLRLERGGGHEIRCHSQQDFLSGMKGWTTPTKSASSTSPSRLFHVSIPSTLARKIPTTAMPKTHHETVHHNRTGRKVSGRRHASCGTFRGPHPFSHSLSY